MVKKSYLSPRADVLACDAQDVLTTSGYLEATEGIDDNMATWEEVFGL